VPSKGRNVVNDELGQTKHDVRLCKTMDLEQLDCRRRICNIFVCLIIYGYLRTQSRKVQWLSNNELERKKSEAVEAYLEIISHNSLIATEENNGKILKDSYASFSDGDTF
jgi:hypothetical protein